MRAIVLLLIEKSSGGESIIDNSEWKTFLNATKQIFEEKFESGIKKSFIN